MLEKLKKYLAKRRLGKSPFSSSKEYWNLRYEAGKNSGPGSYGILAEYKGEFISQFVKKNNINSIIEFGCGDGNQLAYVEYPSYLGFDVSLNAINLCKKKYGEDNSKSFRLMSAYSGEKADLTLSLDVIYHLVEDDVFEEYMERLFRASNEYVVIYSSNYDDKNVDRKSHVRHREYTKWIKNNLEDWIQIDTVQNKYPYKGDDSTGSHSDFVIYRRV